jgi:hypothetical protein
MSTINSNSGHYDNLNSSLAPLDTGDSFAGSFSSCLNFALIDVSVKCNSKYELQIIYSHDGVTDDYSELVTISVVSADTLFYKFEPKMRYYKLNLTNTDSVNQTILILQTLLKSTNTYIVSSGPSSDVNIISPVDGSGNVKVTIQNNPAGNSILLADGFVSTNTDSFHINYLYKNLTVYGSTDTNMILRLELSDDDITYYPTQYQYTVDSGQSLGFNIPAGSYNWVRFAVNNAVNNLILYLNYS